VTPPACTCDGGFHWVSDRWARQMAGISQDATETDVTAEKWTTYQAAKSTVTICQHCAGPGAGRFAR
jgi:hypothetical protein